MAITSMADLNRLFQEVNRRQEEDRSAGRPSIPQGLPEQRMTFEEVPGQYEGSSPPPLQAAPPARPPSVPVASPQQSNLQQLLAAAKGPTSVTIDITGLPGSRDSKLQAVVTPTIDISNLKPGGTLAALLSEQEPATINLESAHSVATLQTLEAIRQGTIKPGSYGGQSIIDLPASLQGGSINIGSELSQVTLHNIETLTKAIRSASDITVGLQKSTTTVVDPSVLASLTGSLKSAGYTGEKIKLKIMSAPDKGAPYPQTLEEKRKAALDALNRYNPEGFKNGDNELIARLAPHLASGIIAKQYDSSTLASYLRSYEKSMYGDSSSSTSSSIFRTATGTSNVDAKSFADSSDNIKKYRLQDLAKEGYNSGLPIGITADILLTLIKSLPEGSSRQNLEWYVHNGDLEKDMRLDGSFAATYDAKKWVGSEEGRFTIGGVFAALGVAGGFLIGGPAGAIAGAGTSIFATTELANYFGMNEFRDKAELQKAGLYPPDHLQEYDKLFSTVKDNVDNLWFNKGKMSPEELKKSYADIKSQVDELGKKLGSEWIFLDATNQYDLEVQRYKALLNSLESLGGTFDQATGVVTSTAKPPAEVTISNIPSGWTVQLGEMKFGSGKDVTAKTSNNVSGVLKITDDKGNVYYGSNYNIYPGGSPTIIGDVRDIVARQSSYSGSTSTSKPPAEVTIANVPAGWTVSIGSLQFGSGKDVKATTDKSISGLLKIVDDKGKTYYGSNFTIYPGGSPIEIGDVRDIVAKQQSYQKPAEASVEGKITIYVPAGYTATYLGQKLQGGASGASYDIKGSAGQQISVLYEAPGKKADTLNTMIPLGGGWKSESKYLEDEYKKETVPSKGIAALNFEPQQAVYLDGQKLDPSKYGLGVLLPAGYHTLVVEEEGYRTASKTVYVPAGESVSLSLKGEAVWTSQPKSSYSGGGGGGGGGGGYSSSSAKPSYAIIVFGSTTDGSTVVLDGSVVVPVVGQQYSVSPGYHSVQVSKPGYKDWTKTVYCGAGDTTYISPALEPLAASGGSVVSRGTSTKRLYVNSTPSGAKILVDSRWTGEYSPSYVDLSPGYHLITFSKSQYSIKSVHVWVCETILTGDAAIAMAEASGIEVNV